MKAKIFTYDTLKDMENQGNLVLPGYRIHQTVNGTIIIDTLNELKNNYAGVLPGQSFCIFENGRGYTLPDNFVNDIVMVDLKKERKKITAILAVSNDDIIGSIDGEGKHSLPWKSLAPDMKRFVQLTTDNVVIMGRNTWESFGGKPLPNRFNIIVSTTLNRLDFEQYENVAIARDVNEALFLADLAIDKKKAEGIYIIGGASIYKEFEPYTTNVELTVVDISKNRPVINPVFLDTSELYPVTIYKTVDASETMTFTSEKNYGPLTYTYLSLEKMK